MKIVTFNTYKGGVGKSTLCYWVAQSLAKSGKKVLIIDLDVQANISNWLLNITETMDLYDYTADKSILKALKSYEDQNQNALAENIIPSKFENIDLIPCASTLGTYEKEMRVKDAYQWFLAQMLSDLGKGRIEKEYDLVLMDTHPGFDNLVTNAVVASDVVLAPIIPSIASQQSTINTEYEINRLTNAFSRIFEEPIKLKYLVNMAKKHTVEGRRMNEFILQDGIKEKVLDNQVSFAEEYNKLIRQSEWLSTKQRNEINNVCNELFVELGL